MNIFTAMENKDKIENREITHHNVLQHHIFSPTPHDREDLHLLKRRRGAWLGGWGGGEGVWLISSFEQNAATRWNEKMYLRTNFERRDISIQ